MRQFLAILLLTISFSSFADEVKVELNPPKPVAGEVFQAYFRIFSESDEEPQINFIPGGLEVVGKANQGVSTRTIYANGKLTVTREMIVVYDLVAEKPGISSIRDITVQLGSNTLRHSAISITVLKEAEVMPDVFVQADVPKKSIFVGEGITVRYYLYSRVPVTNLDVRKYPKLDNFLKRFIQESDQAQRVSVDGKVYLRNQIYAAKLFPEKPGDLKVDPLHLSATYAAGGSTDPFANFGMGMGRDLRTRTISSENVRVEVKPLPVPAPTGFTGLVGKHDFDLQFGQNKLIVNQPLEVKLTVTGGGALENLEAPSFLKNQALEEFETNGDLKLLNADTATKTFDYTFLAKENFKLPASQLSLSYFDPNSEKYVAVQLAIPELEAAGGSFAAPESKDKKEEAKAQSEKPASTPFALPKTVPGFSGPAWSSGFNWRQWMPYINSALALLAVIIAFGFVITKESLTGLSRPGHIPSEFKRGDFPLGEFARWLSPVIQKTGKSPAAIIREAQMDEETKRYFIDLLDANDYKDYSTRKSESKYKYHPGHFKKLSRYIESVKNENPARSA